MVNDASSISRSGYTQNPRLAEAAFEGVRKNTDFLKAADKAFKDVVATKAGDLKAGTKSGESAINTVGLKPPTDARPGKTLQRRAIDITAWQVNDPTGRCFAVSTGVSSGGMAGDD